MLNIIRNHEGNAIGLQYKGYTAIHPYNCTLDIKELLQAKKTIDKKVIEDMEDEQKEVKQKRSQSNFNKLLNAISQNEFLSVDQVISLIKKSNKVYYMYDILSGLNFEITKKNTLKGIDSKNNTIYFSSKKYKGYKFYKNSFIY